MREKCIKIFVYSILLSCTIFLLSFSEDYKFGGINFSNAELLLDPCSGPDTIIFTISQPDSVKILWAKLFWSKNSNPWDSLMMTNTGGNNWRGIIYVSGPAYYRYYVKFMDSLNRTGTKPAGAPATYYTFTVGPDTARPLISHTPIGNTPKIFWPATATAAVTDNCGIDSVWVRWKINQGSGRQFRLMNTTGNIFTSPFNSAQSEVNIGDTIHYRIIAQDISSNHNKDSTPIFSFLITQSIGIEPVSKIIPDRYNLYQNYPNPFNPVTKIKFDIVDGITEYTEKSRGETLRNGLVTLKVYDILGKEIATLVNEKQSPGTYEVTFDASQYASGVYFYRLTADGFNETKRMVLLK